MKQIKFNTILKVNFEQPLETISHFSFKNKNAFWIILLGYKDMHAARYINKNWAYLNLYPKFTSNLKLLSIQNTFVKWLT